MNNQINKYQQRLFNKLFATVPSVKKLKEYEDSLGLDIELNYFYYFNNKDFWFTRGENKEKYIFLFGVKDKPVKNISMNDASLIIDFDKNVQFNNTCLGLFSIKNSEIHILINTALLNKKYPNINISDFKKNNFRSFDNSLDLLTIDLGNLNIDFIENIEKLIKRSAGVKSQIGMDVQDEDQEHLVKLRGADLIKNSRESRECAICSKEKSNFKIVDKLKDLEDLKPELCGRCIEKIFVSEFYTKLVPLLKGNDVAELKTAKEKFGNDSLFDIGLSLMEKYKIIQYIGVKKLLYTIDKSSYLIKKYLKYSDKNNLLIDKFNQTNDSKLEKPNNKDAIENISDSENGNIKDQMDIVIEAISNGKSRKVAAKLANIPLYKIVHWYNEGKIGNKSENIYFYKKMRELETINETNNKELKSNMDQVLNELRNGKSISQIDFIGESAINEWIDKGKQNKKPYVEFYNDYLRLKHSEVVIPKVVKIDSFGNKNTVTKMNIVLENLAKGMCEDDAILEANISKHTYNYWLNRGKQDFGQVYVQFYNYVNQINHEICNDDDLWEEAVQPNKIDPDIYAPLPIEYEKSFSHTSMNQSGIAWVTKIGNKWFYVKTINGKSIRVSDEDIYELHTKVKRSKYVWGIRDYDKARNIIDIPDDFKVPSELYSDEEIDNVPTEVDPGIYAPLPAEYAHNFNPTQTNRIGIAWVNQVGKKWIYTRSIDGKSIVVKADTVYELYDKVKGRNLVWGIRDYDNARKFIDIPDDFEIPSEPAHGAVEENIPTEIDPGIYAPLPKEFLIKFNPSQTNRTGIAWVNQVGKKWIYTRSIDGKSVVVKADTVYELYDKVKGRNLVWGIRDYDKAGKFIDVPKDFVVPKYVDEPVEVSSDILAPLPDEYLSLFNTNQQNRTGIAWVNRIGKKWVYQRKVNGIPIKFSDGDIYKLHEVVIKNNHIWGIVDYDKAKSIIDNNLNFEESTPQITASMPSNKSSVLVTYIEMPLNELDVIIKGSIKNTELINTLNKLSLFEKNIKRMITTSINSEIDLFIEFELNKYLKNSFEEKIRELGWNINK